ncbi:MAG: hypothetical protein WAV41_00655 [Microgenomates group bacterium]
MTTVINSPPSSENNNLGMFVGIFIFLVLGLVFYYFGLPALKQMRQISAPQIVIPNQIDVNIKQTP